MANAFQEAKEAFAAAGDVIGVNVKKAVKKVKKVVKKAVKKAAPAKKKAAKKAKKAVKKVKKVAKKAAEEEGRQEEGREEEGRQEGGEEGRPRSASPLVSSETTRGGAARRPLSFSRRLLPAPGQDRGLQAVAAARHPAAAPRAGGRGAPRR